MPRTIRNLAAVLAALMVVAPAATATPADTSDLTRALAQERYYMGSDNSSPARDAARPKTPSDITRALDQERYYMGQADPTPITPSAPPEIRTDDAPITPSAVPEIRTEDGIARLPFVLAISGALIIGLATGSGLRLLRLRRRHATSTAT